MVVLEARGISGDPCIDEGELQRREKRKINKKRRKEEKRDPIDGIIIETSYTPEGEEE